MPNFSQSMDGNRSFPERPDPRRTPALKMVPPKFKDSMMGGAYAGMGGYGEMGDGVEVNIDAPYGNKKLVDSPFKQNQGFSGTDLTQPAPAETSIRNVRVADLGAGFGNGPLEGSVELAGEQRTVAKKFLPGGRSV